RVEAGGKDDRIELVSLAAGDQAVARDALDRRTVHIDQGDVRTIEGLVIAGVDAQSLAAEYGSGRERRRNRGVVHRFADLGANELGRRLVRLPVDQQVRKGAQEGQSAPRPTELVF